MRSAFGASAPTGAHSTGASEALSWRTRLLSRIRRVPAYLFARLFLLVDDPGVAWLIGMSLARALDRLQLAALVLAGAASQTSSFDALFWFLQFRPAFRSWSGYLALFWVCFGTLMVVLVLLYVFLFVDPPRVLSSALTTAARWIVVLVVAFTAPAVLGAFGPVIACRGGSLVELPHRRCFASGDLPLVVLAVASIAALSLTYLATAFVTDPRPSGPPPLARSTLRPSSFFLAAKLLLLLLLLFSRERAVLRAALGLAAAAAHAALYFFWLPAPRRSALLAGAYACTATLAFAALALPCAASGGCSPALFWPLAAALALLAAPATPLLVRARVALALARVRSRRPFHTSPAACVEIALRAMLAAAAREGRGVAGAAEEALEVAERAWEGRPESARIPARVAALFFDAPPSPPSPRPARPPRRPHARAARAAQAMARKARELHGTPGVAWQVYFLERRRGAEREAWGEEGGSVSELLDEIAAAEREAAVRTAAFWTALLALGAAGAAGGPSEEARLLGDLPARSSAVEASKQRAAGLYRQLLRATPGSSRVLLRYASFQQQFLFDFEGAARTAARAENIVEQRRTNARRGERQAAREEEAAQGDAAGENVDGQRSRRQRVPSTRRGRPLEGSGEEGAAGARSRAPSSRPISSRLRELRSRWRTSAGAQQLAVAGRLQARYRRAFLALHAAALISVVALLALSAATFGETRSRLVAYQSRLAVSLSDAPVRYAVACVGQHAREVALAALPAPPPRIPPSFVGPAARARAAAGLRECAHIINTSLAYFYNENENIVARHELWQTPFTVRAITEGEPVPFLRNSTLFAGIAAVAQAGETLLASSEERLAAAPPEPRVFFLFANTAVALPDAYTAVAFAFRNDTVQRLRGLRGAAAGLFAASVAAVLLCSLCLILPAVLLVKRTRRSAMAIFLEARPAPPPRRPPRRRPANPASRSAPPPHLRPARSTGSPGGAEAAPALAAGEADASDAEAEAEAGELVDAAAATAGGLEVLSGRLDRSAGRARRVVLRYALLAAVALALAAGSFAVILRFVPVGIRLTYVTGAVARLRYSVQAAAFLALELALEDRLVWPGGAPAIQAALRAVLASFRTALSTLLFGGPGISTPVNAMPAELAAQYATVAALARQAAEAPGPFFSEPLFETGNAAVEPSYAFAVAVLEEAERGAERVVGLVSLFFVLALALILALYLASLLPSIQRMWGAFASDGTMLLHVPYESLRRLPAAAPFLPRDAGDGEGREEPLSALAAVQQQSKSLLAASLDPTLILDAGGIVQRANAAAAKAFGFGACEEMEGRPARDLLPALRVSDPDAFPSPAPGAAPDDPPCLELGLPAACGAAAPVEAVRRDGARFPATVSLGRGVAAEGGEPFFVLVARDVRRRLEEEAALRGAMERADALLLAMVPADVAGRLKAGEQLIADSVDDASLLFFDLVGFTKRSSSMTPAQTVALVQAVFLHFDAVNEEERFRRIERVKLIGDAAFYFIRAPHGPELMVDFALEVLRGMRDVSARVGFELLLRAGVNTGSVVTGVIATRKIAWDVYGDSVATANLLEQHGVPGRVQISSSTYERVKYIFETEARTIETVKGTMKAFLVVRRRSSDMGTQLQAAKLIIGFLIQAEVEHPH
eukprot:tig00000970_g5828.t1